jgi:hypothetical protein
LTGRYQPGSLNPPRAGFVYLGFGLGDAFAGLCQLSLSINLALRALLDHQFACPDGLLALSPRLAVAADFLPALRNSFTGAHRSLVGSGACSGESCGDARDGKGNGDFHDMSSKFIQEAGEAQA